LGCIAPLEVRTAELDEISELKKAKLVAASEADGILLVYLMPLDGAA
jgi:hypothetical protein